MELHAVEHLHEGGAAVVHDLTVPDVQLGDLSHVPIAEGKIPDIHVLLHAVPVDRLGDDHHPPLDVPPQGHLGGGLAVLLSDGGEDGMGEDAVLSLGKGPSKPRE